MPKTGYIRQMLSFYSLVNESIFFVSVIPSGTNLLLAWVAQMAEEKNVQTLTWNGLASKEFECEKGQV